MRDQVLDEALKRLAAETATRFSALVATGDEIPFDVAENDGESSHFYRYVPLTASYLEARFDEVRSLPAYGPARGAAVASGVAATFLESRGMPVPADPASRADEMLQVFIAGLWEGATEFSLNMSRVDAALEAMEVQTRDIREADRILVPLNGFEMTLDDVEFSNGVRIVRANSTIAPVEALSSEGTDRDAWQPACLASVELGTRPDAPRMAVAKIARIITALRLKKEGCVGLGTHAFAPVGDGVWRRLETGANSGRRGTYLMVEADVDEIDALVAAVGRADSAPFGMDFALRRFEYGLERDRPLDALSDHLLAIRSAMTGESLIDTPVPVRAAALVGGHDAEPEIRGRMEAAFELEATLMGGGGPVTEVGGESASYLAAWVEDSVRGMLRMALLGEFGSDLNATAEEILITEGLGSGEGSISQMGSEEEWGPAMSPSADSFDGPGAEIHVLHPNGLPGLDPDGPPTGFHPGAVPEFETPDALEGEDSATSALTPMPEIEAALGISGADDFDDDLPEMLTEPRPEPGEIRIVANREFEPPTREASPPAADSWLDQARAGTTMEWPSPGLGGHLTDGSDDRRSGKDRDFFPPVDRSEWEVSELRYSRRQGPEAV